MWLCYGCFLVNCPSSLVASRQLKSLQATDKHIPVLPWPVDHVTLPPHHHNRAWTARLENVEAAWAQRLEAEQRAAAARLDEAKQRAAAERAAAEEKWAVSAGEAEGAWRRKLDELRSK